MLLKDEEASKKAEQAMDKASDALTAVRLLVGQIDALRDRLTRLEKKYEISNEA